MYFTQGDCYHYGPVYISNVDDLNSGVTSQEDEYETKNAAIVRKKKIEQLISETLLHS